jgi:DNA polymerase-1
MIENTLKEVNATEYKGWLTDGRDNFRKHVYPEYKANRKQEKPVNLTFLQEFVKKNWGAEIAIGMEADDALGIAQIEGKDSGTILTTDSDWNSVIHNANPTVICSIDKDLLQVPGNHYNFVKKEFKVIDEYTGRYNFYTQLLTGDATDNIKGVEGIGPKKAAQALEGLYTEEEMFEQVCCMYDNDEYMLMNGICLHIKRTKEDNWKDTFERLVQRQT